MNEALPDPTTLKPLQFGRIAPTVAVRDIDRAVAFYCGVLGFDKSFENGSPTAFVILERDADYGLRTFVLADPDGNHIDVGEAL